MGIGVSISIGGGGGIRPRKAIPTHARLDAWIPYASLAIPRYGAGAFFYGGKLYVVGGVTTGGRTTVAVETIDLSTGERGYAQSMPSPRSHFAGVYVGGKYYVIGGADKGGSPTDTIFEYDPASDSWNTLPVALPTPLMRLCGDAVDDATVIVCGGMDGDGNVVGTTVSIDLSAQTATQRSGMNTPRQNHACGALGGKLYVFGGDDGSGALLSSIEQYDPSTDTWSTMGATLPEGLTGLRATRINVNGRDYLLLIGG